MPTLRFPLLSFLPLSLLSGAFSAIAQTTPAEPAPAEPEIILSPFEVNSTGDSYTASMTTTGTRVASLIKELPFTVDVVTADFMQDFAAFEPAEQFAFVGSYTQLDGEGTYRLRGMSAAGLLRNGFFRGGLIDKVNVERAEVIKGPAAAIYGRAAPGGVVNIITKVPKPTAETTFSTWAGGDHFLRAEASMTGPIIKDKLLYRLDAAHTENDGVYNLTGHDSTSVSGAVTYRFAPRTSLIVELENLRRYDYGQSATTPWLVQSGVYVRPMLELGTFTTQADGAYHLREITSFNFTFDHRFTSTLSLRVGGFGSQRDLEILNMGGANYRVTTAGVREIYSREPSWRFNPQKSRGLQADLLKEFSLGPTQHKLLVTVDYLSDHNGADVIRRLPTALLTNAAYNIRNLNVDAPNYYIDENIADYTRYVRDSGTEVEIFGTFVSDRITFLNGKLVALIGGRIDRVESYLWDDLPVRNGTGVRAQTTARVTQPTYQSGLNYTPIPQLTFYVSSSTSFRNQTGGGTAQNQNGEAFPAEEGEGIDTGIKASFLDQRLNISASIFEQTRKNVVREDEFITGLYTFSGEERVRGFESALNANFTPEFTVFANYSYLDSEVILADAYLIGRDLQNTPSHQMGAGFRYRFRDGFLKGVSVNAAWRYYGAVSPYVSNDNRLNYRQPSYQLVDFGASYGFKSSRRFNHTIGVNVKNLLDETYYVGAGRLANDLQALVRYSIRFR